jgi:hypothetical protein
MPNDIEQMLSENVHYEIVPADDIHGWNIRLLEDYPETVISFGTISFDAIEEEDGYISFNFSIVSTPDPDLTTEDLTFQAYVGRILSAVIEKAITEGTMIAKDNETNAILATEDMLEDLHAEHQSGADGITEPSDQ